MVAELDLVEGSDWDLGKGLDNIFCSSYVLNQNAFGHCIHNCGAETPLTTQVSNLTDFFNNNKNNSPQSNCNKQWLADSQTDQLTSLKMNKHNPKPNLLTCTPVILARGIELKMSYSLYVAICISKARILPAQFISLLLKVVCMVNSFLD